MIKQSIQASGEETRGEVVVMAMCIGWLDPHSRVQNYNLDQVGKCQMMSRWNVQPDFACHFCSLLNTYLPCFLFFFFFLPSLFSWHLFLALFSFPSIPFIFKSSLPHLFYPVSHIPPHFSWFSCLHSFSFFYPLIATCQIPHLLNILQSTTW